MQHRMFPYNDGSGSRLNLGFPPVVRAGPAPVSLVAGSGLQSRVSGFWARACNRWFRVYHPGFRVSGLGLTIQGFEIFGCTYDNEFLELSADCALLAAPGVELCHMPGHFRHQTKVFQGISGNTRSFVEGNSGSKRRFSQHIRYGSNDPLKMARSY